MLSPRHAQSPDYRLLSQSVLSLPAQGTNAHVAAPDSLINTFKEIILSCAEVAHPFYPST